MLSMGLCPLKEHLLKAELQTCELASNALTLERQLDALYRQLTVQSVWNFLQSTCWSKDYYLKNYKIYKIIFFLHVFYLIYHSWKECKVHNAPLNRSRPTSSCTAPTTSEEIPPSQSGYTQQDAGYTTIFHLFTCCTCDMIPGSYLDGFYTLVFWFFTSVLNLAIQDDNYERRLRMKETR